MKHFDQLSSEESENLVKAWEAAYREEHLLKIKDRLVDFLQRMQSHAFKVIVNDEEKQVEVLDIIYYRNAPTSYISAAPCSDFYEVYEDEHVRLDYFDDGLLEDMMLRVLKENNIEFSESEYDLITDQSEHWPNKLEFEIQFMMECWREAKYKSQGTRYGFLHASDGSEDTFNLDTGERFDFFADSISYVKHLADKGIEVTSYIKSQEEKRGGFLKRLFGRK